jgi:hypothetical protein
MGFFDFVSSIRAGVSDTFQSFGKNITNIASEVISTVGTGLNKVFDTGGSIVNTVVDRSSNVINKVIDTGGGIVNKGLDIGGGALDKGLGVVNTLSYVPLVLIAGGAFLVYTLINNAQPVSQGIATVATSVGPLVAKTAVM